MCLRACARIRGMDRTSLLQHFRPWCLNASPTVRRIAPTPLKLFATSGSRQHRDIPSCIWRITCPVLHQLTSESLTKKFWRRSASSGRAIRIPWPVPSSRKYTIHTQFKHGLSLAYIIHKEWSLFSSMFEENIVERSLLGWQLHHSSAVELPWPYARAPGSSPGGNSQLFGCLFPFTTFPPTWIFCLVLLRILHLSTGRPRKCKGTGDTDNTSMFFLLLQEQQRTSCNCLPERTIYLQQVLQLIIQLLSFVTEASSPILNWINNWKHTPWLEYT